MLLYPPIRYVSFVPVKLECFYLFIGFNRLYDLVTIFNHFTLEPSLFWLHQDLMLCHDTACFWTYNKNISFMFWHTLVKTKFCINYKYVLHIYVSTWFSFYNFILLQFHAGDLCPFMTCCTIGVVENSWTNKSFLLGSQLLKYEPFQCFLFYVLFIWSTTYVKYFTEQPCCSALYTINHLLFIDDRQYSRAGGTSFMYVADS